MTPLRISLGIAALATAGLAFAQTVADDCGKNHYILSSPACTWKRVGDLHAERSGHTATLLENGTVLVVGGGSDGRTGTFTGWVSPITPPDSAEIFDPRTGSWRLVAPLAHNRSGHTATLLNDGRVLVVGGETSYHHTAFRNGTAEIFDPATETWTLTGSMNSTRWPDTAKATLLPDGKVLVVGGWAMDDWPFGAEIYDPQTGAWTPASALHVGRYGHSATTLPGGKVLVAAGMIDDIIGRTTSASEIYDPATGLWTPASSALFDRMLHSETALADGRVLVAGGWTTRFGADGQREFGVVVASTEIFDPMRGEWTRAPDLLLGRVHHTSTLMSDGTVLTVGGFVTAPSGSPTPYVPVDSVEVRKGPAKSSVIIGSLNEARVMHTATRLPDGSVLVVGGLGAAGPALRSAELMESSAAR